MLDKRLNLKLNGKKYMTVMKKVMESLGLAKATKQEIFKIFSQKRNTEQRLKKLKEVLNNQYQKFCELLKGQILVT